MSAPRVRPPTRRPAEPTQLPPNLGLLERVVLLLAAAGTAVTAGAITGHLTLGIIGACAAVALGGSALHRTHAHDQARTAAATALTSLGVITAAPGRPPSRRWARSWRGGWIGHPTRLTLHTLPDIDTAAIGWQTDLRTILTRRFGIDYRISQTNPRRCIVKLRPAPPNPDTMRDPLHQRAVDIAALLLGDKATTHTVLDDNGELQAVTATYPVNPRIASPVYRARIEAIYSAMLPGRWRARWDIENNKVRLERRPHLPARIPRPPATGDTDLNRIPIAVGEDGQIISWHLRGTGPHALVAGKTGSGKTVGILGIVFAAAARGWPVWVCDPKRVEFLGLRGWPNVQIVATTVEDQVAVIHAAWKMMEDRYAAIEDGTVDESTFEPLVLVLDEYRDFVGMATEWYATVKRTGMPSKCPAFEKVMSLARKGRTARVHLVLGTQRPDAEFLGGEALATATPIPTPHGWTTMGDLEPGDTVFNEDGQPVQVTATTPITHGRPCYRITFSDTSTIITDANHLWSARSQAQRLGDHTDARSLTRAQRWPHHQQLQRRLAGIRAGDPREVTVAEFEAEISDGSRIELLRRRIHDGRLGLRPAGIRPGPNGRYSARTYRFADLATALNAEVTSPPPTWRRPGPDVVTTEEMYTSLDGRRKGRNWSIQVAQALDLPEADLPIDPWLLGYWLGDGDKNTATIATADEDVLTRIRGLGYRVTHYARFNYGIAHGQARKNLKADLRDLGVLKNKHIPTSYLRASESQRAQLLAGLLDSDGTCAVRGNATASGQVVFTNVDYGLIEGVAELAASLGLIPTIRQTRPARIESCTTSVAYGRTCRPTWAVRFTPDRQVFGIRRKQHALTPSLIAPRRATLRRRYVVSIDPVRSVPVRCITVDTPTHLYLAGPRFIPTHNCRDNFATRISFGRLSPQGAQMMWESPSAGVSVPSRIPGRGTGLTDDDEPVEMQAYYTPDPRRATTAQDLAELEEHRPAATRHLPLRVRPLEHLLAPGDGKPLIWEAYSNAELVPAESLPTDEPSTSVDAPMEPAESHADDGYGPVQSVSAEQLQPGDLIDLDGLQVVVEVAVPDVDDDELTVLDWRGDDDSAGSLSVGRRDPFDTRRMIEEEQA